MEKYLIKAIREETLLNAVISFFGANQKVTIECEVGQIKLESKDEYPFFALIKIREKLEQQGILLLCNGARIDIYPSGMSAVGLMAYELIMGKQAEKLLNIFEPVTDVSKIASVKEQKNYRERWFDSLK